MYSLIINSVTKRYFHNTSSLSTIRTLFDLHHFNNEKLNWNNSPITSSLVDVLVEFQSVKNSIENYN